MPLKLSLKSMPLYAQILLGMGLGIVIGFVALSLQGGETFIAHWIKPWGELFVRLLQLIAVPLIFVTLVKGVMGLKDIHSFSRLGGKTMLLYLVFIVASVIFGLSLGLLADPGTLVNPDIAAMLQDKYAASVADKAAVALEVNSRGPLHFLREIVPSNIVMAASSNSTILQVIFFAVLFGVAALMVKPEQVASVVKLFDALDTIIMKMVSLIISTAPIGVTALMAGLVTDFRGDASMFSALGLYALTVIVALLVIMYLFYPIIIRFCSRTKVRDFLRALYPVQLFAFTTSSSAVTLPVTMKAVKEQLHISDETASFVLPVGVTVNMDGSSCYQAISILFVAQVLGINLEFSQLLTILLMTVLSSIGTPGIPGGSYVILAMVLTSVGIPPEGLALIIGLDRPLDMLRTSVNVTGDAVVACMVDRK
ncbi:MAG: dicarboxylate/amino acid:cation symporter [Prevotellaceae bacterium]|jgi:Na+/H+-dicarboxylate symporter|nr:dicarboxylate/amino acid:cation symporter [Prevotellaceae bacterium]